MHTRRIIIPVLAVTLACVATGCAYTPPYMAGARASSSTQSSATADQQDTISRLEQQLQARDAELLQARAEQADAGQMPVDSELFPPNPQPGACYARILIPARYTDSQETLIVKEATESIEILPATYETVTETVVVKDAATRLEVIPATYETVTEQFLVKPASRQIEQIPATYRTVTEQVMVTPARTEWKRGPASSFGSASVLDSRTTDTGEIMCLVEVPAVYETVTRQVVDRPASSREIEIPAEYRTVTKEVLVTPATTREVMVPAEYATVEVVRQVSPAQEQRITIPAEYETVVKRELVSADRLEWRQVVCDVNLTSSNIMALQRALNQRGNYDGPIDGILGPRTLAGANAFAQSLGLPTGSNYIAKEVVDRLDLGF